MIRAYDKIYLERARRNLARMLDFAVYDLHMDLEEFFSLFIASGTAGLFETGDISTLAGKSGVELAYDVLERSGLDHQRISPAYTMNRSPEYWTGWALAYYQWETGLSFADIIRYIPISEIMELYDPFHEMDIRQFIDYMNETIRNRKQATNLKLLRTKTGMTQAQLARDSGLPLRTIQQYEQRQKNINKAQAESLFRLASALGCDPSDLLERIEF